MPGLALGNFGEVDLDAGCRRVSHFIVEQ